ncbi:hypothetical protein FB565_003587 [Actinoplanes lutulentus]|uniref:Uncharacterized protein n=1 Tax=Actinoplanes lutulentus TaxID=1287878 RepID=A0A327Z2S9_9ACTN|nr:hypothetical protein [Actinoplanes lutulentus]MBB2943858.1 hypothetical protein [Actinoplanes lutulentus]RAK29399.1 hypothetical protein B0I29_118191 [Actinoplanes lutulentus]
MINGGLLEVLGGVPGLFPRAEQRVPPIVTWDDGPCGSTAAAALAAAGWRVTEPFWGGALVDLRHQERGTPAGLPHQQRSALVNLPDYEPCVFQRVLRPETAALLYLHAGEYDSPAGDARVARRVFGTDLPPGGYLPSTGLDRLAVHLLTGEVGAGCDFSGENVFATMGAAVRSTFGGRAGLFTIARGAAI